MYMTANPCAINGTVDAVSSKSEAHRTLIAAALSDAPCEIQINDMSQDIESTLECIVSLGAKVCARDNLYTVYPIEAIPKSPVFNCRSSGSTLRFFVPVAAAKAENARFECSEQLSRRPMRPLLNALEAHGINCSHGFPLEISGSLTPGEYHIMGNVSSQFISGLMFALPLLPGDSTIVVDGSTKSKSYIEMTADTLHKFGIKVMMSEDEIHIRGNQKYISPGRIDVGGDFSAASALLCAAALSGSCTVRGLDIDSAQGDKKIIDFLIKFGAEIKISGDEFTVRKNRKLPINIDISDNPDLFPALAVLSCGAVGKSCFYGTDRLRYKESDRIASVKAMLETLGVRCVAAKDQFAVFGTGRVTGGTVDGMDDHRIVMAAAAASSIAESDITVSDAESVRKSYPDFFRDFALLGGKTAVKTIH